MRHKIRFDIIPYELLRAAHTGAQADASANVPPGWLRLVLWVAAFAVGVTIGLTLGALLGVVLW